MERRNFIKALIAGTMAISSVAGFASEKADKVIVWLKNGVLSYKNKATKDKIVAGKICLNCKWYKDDPNNEHGGLCNLKAVQNAMKNEEVYVHSAGNCNMWTKG